MEPTTPMMAQYHHVKKEFPQALVFFRLGDFYELFFDDAVVASRELEITLTSRNKEKGLSVPMCGVPYHAADSYIAKLIRKGYKVAICDQVENPKMAKKLVRREVTRVVTPGTVADGNLLDPQENNFLSSIYRESSGVGLALIDLSTGDFRTTEFLGPLCQELLQTELERSQPKEIIHPAIVNSKQQSWSQNTALAKTPVEDWAYAQDYAQRLLSDHFGVMSLDGFGCQGKKLAVAAAGAILHYLKETQKASLGHIDQLRYYDLSGSMVLDQSTVRNLELVESLFDGSRHATLIASLDKTSTGMGARLLKNWLLRPEIDLKEITSRLDAVGILKQQLIEREEIKSLLRRVYDVERLLSKVALSTANARDLISLKTSLEQVPAIRAHLQKLAAERLQVLKEEADPLEDVSASIGNALKDNPPILLTDGGLIREGYHAGLDDLRSISTSGKQFIAELEARERARTGIHNLKVKFNNIFGYYLEISKSNLNLVPPDYERKQTLVGAERFTTPELKDYERKVLGAEEQVVQIEYDLFCQLRSSVAREAKRIRKTAAALAQLDGLVSLAEVAHTHNYVRPQLLADGDFVVTRGRHPVIEQLGDQLSTGKFIPNDLYLNDSSDQILIITGPNMGGKSTYLRQTALFSILSQMGSFVPAESAQLSIVDRIFTRIGATDNLARGRSTFMVEMTESAVILNTATSKSLIILDEIGRGTATFDGLSIAWSVLEYLHHRTRAKTLFATHYHELTELADLLPGVKNYHVAVKESGNNIVFLRKVEPGSADKSYGIEVAKLAGLPQSVLDRAREILRKHEEGEHEISDHLTKHYKRKKATSSAQLNLFMITDHEVLEELRQLNLDSLTPLQALEKLSEFKSKL
ncbi:MAG: DNA mismatch repair protein MutS [Acidobacteria bacterium]|nr:MAG: DNA mismatch repair protein MutS [Acidobacteriota bacterium]